MEGHPMHESPRRGLRDALLAAPLTLVALAGCTPADDTAALRDGPWRAALSVPGGELPFGLDVATEQGRKVAYLVNGSDRVRVTEIEVRGDAVTMRMPGFSHRIEARLDGDALEGAFVQVRREGEELRVPLLARHGLAWRFSPDAASATPAAGEPGVEGRWSVTFVNDEGKSRVAVGEFRQQGRLVTGTFLQPTGDARFLAGELRGRELRLSKFDGGSALLYHATLADDGTLSGRLWYSLTSTESFTARRDEAASLAGFEQATQMKAGADRLDFRFPDLGGTFVSLRDPFFHGKVVIVTLAGSWCPNCHDEAAFLAGLHRRLRERGLEVVSLMFEQFGDFDRAAEATHRFRERYDVDYTTLIAGISDKDDAASRLPQLNGVYAFPTTIFVDRQGKVRRLHTGFSGPATGRHYDELVRDFTAQVETLLAEPGPPPLPPPVATPAT
jgi:thiol-disulfide isomerase/thioredoxin